MPALIALLDFDKNVRKAKKDGKDFFKPTGGEPFSYRSGAGGIVSWSLSLELKRTEAQ